MVVEYDPGKLVRSFVRVPGSGIDTTAKNSCLDLGRTSAFAANVSVPPSLPPSIQVASEKRWIQEDEIEMQAKSFKKSRNDPPQKLFINANTQPKIVIAPPSSQNLVLVTFSHVDASKLLQQQKLERDIKEELDTLKEENKELKRKLSLCQQLFKDKKRLRSVVERLGIKVMPSQPAAT